MPATKKKNVKIWTGDDTHIGIYKPKDISPEEARINTIKKMLRFLPKLKKSSKVLLLGSGFGGTARYLFEEFGCKVDCLNDNEAQNAYHQEMIEAGEMVKKVNVQTGTIADIHLDRENYDVVWAHELSAQSAKTRTILREIHRVLQTAGRCIFTDVLLNDDCPPTDRDAALSEDLQDRLLTAEQYERLAKKNFLQQIYSIEMTPQLELHYQAVLDHLHEHKSKITKASSAAHHKELVADTEAWLKAAQSGCVDWGILIFQKINN